MKLIQILALTMAIASVASGQSAGTADSKPGGKAATPPGTKPAVTAHPVPASKPTPVTRKAHKGNTTVTAKKAPSVKAKSVHPASGTAGKQAVSARQTAPATKTGAAPGKPVVAVGSLPAKKTAGAPGTKHVPAVRARSVKPAQKAVPAARPKVSVVPGKKPEVRKTGAAKKPEIKKPEIKKAGAASKPSRPSVARVEGAPKPEPKPRTPAKLLGAAGRRDPFVSPLRSASAIAPTSSCTSGKRCLSIPELVLQGTVRDISGKMMAVVSTSNRKTYTLRENDQVFNGSVEKITTDSIIFREYVRDPLGRESAREVVKKLGPTS